MTWGEYDFEDRRNSKTIARRLFYRTIQEQYPGVLADLANEPLAIFAAAPYCGDDACVEAIRTHLLGNSHHQLPPDHEYLPEALRRWGVRWHLDVTWCLAHALETLVRWAAVPSFKGIHWEFGSYEPSVPPSSALSFRFMGRASVWEPMEEKWEEFKRGQIAELELRLENYRYLVEKMLPPGSVKVEDRVPEHFVWLVMFQVGQLSFQQIGLLTKPPTSRTNVSKAVRAAARFIDLPLRPHPEPFTALDPV